MIWWMSQHRRPSLPSDDLQKPLRVFAGRRCLRLARRANPSDTRSMPALAALFERGA